MDAMRLLLDLAAAGAEVERVRREQAEKLIQKYGAELGIEVSGCCGDEKTDCHGALPLAMTGMR